MGAGRSAYGRTHLPLGRGCRSQPGQLEKRPAWAARAPWGPFPLGLRCAGRRIFPAKFLSGPVLCGRSDYQDYTERVDNSLNGDRTAGVAGRQLVCPPSVDPCVRPLRGPSVGMGSHVRHRVSCGGSRPQLSWSFVLISVFWILISGILNSTTLPRRKILVVAAHGPRLGWGRFLGRVSCAASCPLDLDARQNRPRHVIPKRARTPQSQPICVRAGDGSG